MKNIAIPFDWNIICQVCRQKIKASESLKRWDGLIVCKDDYETRHPLDMPAPRQSEERVLPFTYSEEVEEVAIEYEDTELVLVDSNPFVYTTGSSPEEITFGGEAEIVSVTINGQFVGTPATPFLAAAYTTISVTYI